MPSGRCAAMEKLQEVEEVEEGSGRKRASGRNEPTACSRQPTVREKQGGKSGGEYAPSPLILSLGGARKIKEKGYHRTQADLVYSVYLVYPVCLVYPVGGEGLSGQVLRSSDW